MAKKRRFLDRVERDRLREHAHGRFLARVDHRALSRYFPANVLWHWLDESARQWSLERWDAALDPAVLQPGLAEIRARTLGEIIHAPPSEIAGLAAQCLHRHARLRYLRHELRPYLGGSLAELGLDAWEAVRPDLAEAAQDVADETEVKCPFGDPRSFS